MMSKVGLCLGGKGIGHNGLDTYAFTPMDSLLSHLLACCSVINAV